MGVKWKLRCGNASRLYSEAFKPSFEFDRMETDMLKQMDVSGTNETIINRRNRGQLIENNWKRHKLCSKGNVATRLGDSKN